MESLLLQIVSTRLDPDQSVYVLSLIRSFVKHKLKGSGIDTIKHKKPKQVK